MKYFFSAILIAMLITFATIASMKEPNVAGSFYPGNKKELSAMISRFMVNVPKPKPVQDTWAIIVPHAGYVYSGQTAAYAFKQVEGKQYDTVIVIAPSHVASFEGAAVYTSGGFKTPLGAMHLDEVGIRTLLKSDIVRDMPGAFEREHALEVQLPFIQTVLPSANLIPLIVGQVSLNSSAELADALLPLVKDKKVLVVISSDMSHYKPADVNDALDERAINYLEENDPQGLLRSAAKGDCEMCGLGPVLTVMFLAKKMNSKAVILHHTNSGETTGDTGAVVGYMAAMYPHPVPPPVGEGDRTGKQARGTAGEGSATMDEEFNLTKQEQKALLKLARDSIAAHLQGKTLPSTELSFPKAARLGAAFVTLEKKGQLRGCIGHIRAMRPLSETIQEMAQAAAFHDPRFSPVTAPELADIDIEISVLSPMRRISDVNEINVGKHGLYITQGYNSGLLLPQVATEQGWDRDEFLMGVCQKAGLPPNAWQRGAVIQVFTAEIFHE